MKRLIWAGMLLCVSLSVYARHDGAYMNVVTDNFATPHLEWGTVEQSKKLRVLFIITRQCAREAVELTQRYPMERSVFVTYNHNAVTVDSPYDASLNGCTAFEKSQEIRDLAQKQYDVIIVSTAQITSLPPDAQCQLLQQVREGCGLVLINHKNHYPKLFATAEPKPAFMATGKLPHGFIDNIKTTVFGKGRIVSIPMAHWSLALPQYEMDSKWAARYEAAQAFVIRSIRWAAKQDNVTNLDDVTIANGVISLKTPADAVLRLRDEFNNIIASVPFTDGSARLPHLPNGHYFCDIIAGDGSFAMHAFDHASELGEVFLDTLDGADCYERNQTVALKAQWTNGAKTELTLTTELISFPGNLVWMQKSAKIPAGATTADVTINDFWLPTIAGDVALTWRDKDGKQVAHARKFLFFPKRIIPDYFQLGWDIPANPNQSRQLVDNIGFGLALIHPSPAVNKKVAALNARQVPYLTRITIAAGPKGEVKQKMLTQLSSKTLQEKVKALGDDQSFARPEIREIIAEQVEERMKELAKYGPALYSLGDENVNNLECGYGPSDVQGFRDFVKGKYGDIGNLNREWKTGFASYDQVPHIPGKEALAMKNFPAWNDHCEYMENMFARIHHEYAREIKKRDKYARVGLEGTFGGHNFEEMMDGLDWWGPYSNGVEDELLRSLYPNVPRFLWAGYHGERGDDKYPNISRFLLKGTVNGNGWFSTNVFDVHCILGVDYSPSYRKDFMDELQRLRFGLGQLLVNNPITHSGITLYWNHASRRADKASANCVRADSSILPFLRYCYGTGLGVEFATSRTMNRLKDGYSKILFLFGASLISDEDAAAILDYVKNGGMVVADINPAVMNKYFRFREANPLAELFGNITVNEKTPALEIKPLEIKLSDGSCFKADKVLLQPNQTAYQAKQYGKGRAILLNFNLAMAETSASAETPLSSLLSSILREAGIEQPCSMDKDATLRVRDGKGFSLIGVSMPDRVIAAGESLTISLPAPRYVYQCGKGFMGKDARINVKFDRQALYLYAAFERKQEAPDLKLPGKLEPGEAVPLDFSKYPKGRVMLVKVIDPDGNEMIDRSFVIDTAKTRKASFHFAFNDKPGKYKLSVQDVTTGLSQTKTIKLKD